MFEPDYVKGIVTANVLKFRTLSYFCSQIKCYLSVLGLYGLIFEKKSIKDILQVLQGQRLEQ